MENSNNITSLLQSSEGASLDTMDTSYGSNGNGEGGFLNGLKQISLTTWLIVILILAFLGFNVFVYLAKGTQDITNWFQPILQKLFGTTANVTGQIVDVSAEGAKAVVNTTAGAINTGLSAVQNITPQSASTSISSQSVQSTLQEPDLLANNSLQKALNTSQMQSSNTNEDYQPHEAPSSVHLVGKSGWCYIGEDRGFRSCAKVGPNDECMSGDIFPSRDICINPTLRA
jgi:hypothetical protein